MKKLIAKPHLFFFGLTFTFIILGFINRNENFDFNFGENYYVFNLDFWYYLSAIFFMLIGFNYYSLVWAQKPAKKWLTILHILLQTLSLLLLATKDIWNLIGKQHPEGFNNMTDNSQTVFALSILLFIVSIFFHFVNFFVTLFLKKN